MRIGESRPCPRPRPREYRREEESQRAREKFSPLERGEDRFKRSWRAIKSLNYGQCRDANTVACAHVRTSLRSRYCCARTTRRRVNANISPTSVMLDGRTDREPLSLRFYAPIFAPRTHIPSSRIPSASRRPYVCNFDTLLHAFISHY